MAHISTAPFSGSISNTKTSGSYCEESRCTVKKGVTLKVNGGLTSPNGISKFEVREDGNLILKCKNKEVWSTEITEITPIDGATADPFLLIQVRV